MKKRVIWLIFVLLILAGGATLCVLRWDAWFTNPAEPLYDVPDEPNNIVLTFGELAAVQRTVSWRAGQDTSVVSQTDAMVKIASVVPGFAGTNVFFEQIGFPEDMRRKAISEIERNAGGFVLSQVFGDGNADV